MSHVAFLGTGLLGAAMVEAACARGEQVVVWNRSHEKATPLERFGARVVATAGEAVREASRVHLVLKDDEVVDEVLGACGERLKGSLILDHTTTGPAGTRSRAADLAEQGIEFLHAPVFMTPNMARKTEGIILASGPTATYAKAKDALEKMTGKVEYLGERSDLAAAYKLFGNAMIFTVTAGLADVFALGRSLEIEPKDVLKLFDFFNPAGGVKSRAEAMANGNFKPSFELTMARKDARLMVEAGQLGEVPLSLLPVIAAWMDRLIGAGFGREDYSALAREAVLGREPPPSLAKLPTNE